METATLLCLVILSVPFAVYDSCTACYNAKDEKVEGILGEDVNLTCNTFWTCDNIYWYKERMGETAFYSGEHVSVAAYESHISISGVTFHDAGSYTCWCYSSSSPSEICSVTLQTICQATVLLNGRTILYNSSLPSTPFLDVTAGDTISIACSKNAILGTSCQITLLQASDELSGKFEVLQNHNSCPIECRLRSEDGVSCSVGFTLNVIWSETSGQPSTSSSGVSTTSSHPTVNGNALTVTSTSNIPPAPATVVIVSAQPSVKQSLYTTIPNDRFIISASAHTTIPVVQQMEKDNSVPDKSGSFPDKSGSFPVMLFIGIPIVVFVGILFIICFLMYFLRSKSTSRLKKTQNLGNESPDTNIPIGPTYATINKSSLGGDEDSAEGGIPCTDDAYDEVGRDVKREPTQPPMPHILTQQDNAVKAETSITKDYYSVVNTSNTKLESTDSGSKSDSALYTEVNKEVKQAGKNVGALFPESSGCNTNVADVPSDPPYDVLEQPESSEYNAVGVVSSSALYAVVEKERKKE